MVAMLYFVCRLGLSPMLHHQFGFATRVDGLRATGIIHSVSNIYCLDYLHLACAASSGEPMVEGQRFSCNSSTMAILHDYLFTVECLLRHWGSKMNIRVLYYLGLAVFIPTSHTYCPTFHFRFFLLNACLLHFVTNREGFNTTSAARD